MDTYFYTLGPVKRLSHALTKAGSFGPGKTFLLTLNDERNSQTLRRRAEPDV